MTFLNECFIALSTFKRQIKEQGRRSRSIALIRGSGFDIKSRTYSAKISAIAVRESWSKCKDCRIALVALARNDGVPYEDNIQISIGKERRCSKTDREDFHLEVKLKEAARLNRGDTIDAHLLLIPPNLTEWKGRTIGEMIANGCDVIDSSGETITSMPKKQIQERVMQTAKHHRITTWKKAAPKAAAKKAAPKKGGSAHRGGSVKS